MMSNAPKIEKNVPFPTGWSRWSDRISISSVLRAMEVGDSFVMPNPKKMPLPDLQRRAKTLSYAAKPKRFATRMVEENGARVLRVWRTE